MVQRSLRFLIGAAVLVLLSMQALAQDAEKGKKARKAKEFLPEDVVRPGEEYRQFFKKPTTVPEFWNAMKFEIELGKYDLAARLMHGLLIDIPDIKKLKPTDAELVALEEKDGMSAFLRLRNIRSWAQVPPFDPAPYDREIEELKKKDPTNLERRDRIVADRDKAKQAHDDAIALNAQAEKDVEELIKMVTKAVKKHLSDPVRINHYVKNLLASPEEHAYALKQLYRSGALVVPYLLNELSTLKGADRVPLLAALARLGEEVVPPLLPALDSDDSFLQQELIDLFVKRKATEAVPYLWYLSGSPGFPPEVRRKASDALARFHGVPRGTLPSAKVALTREAEKYYQHQVTFADPNSVPLWRWNGRTVTLTNVPATRAEEYYGMRFANEALALDPAYEPAQVVLLSLIIDKTYERTGLSQPLDKAAPKVHELLATTNPELLNTVLERALTDKRVPVILGTIRTLGGLAEVRANRPTTMGQSAMVRALNYPDRRVHFAAADALLNIPGAAFSQQTTRIVDILRRAIAAEPTSKGVPRVLVAYFSQDLAHRVGDAVKAAGYEAVTVTTGRELLKRLNEAADIDLILMDEALPDPGLASLLAQIRADRNAGQIPILLTVSKEREDRVKRYIEEQKFKTVTVIPAGFALDPTDLQILFNQRMIDPLAPALTAEEVKEYAEKAIRHLAHLARGEPAGFDVKPAGDAVANALRSGRFSPEGQLAAVDVLARIPGKKAQDELANVVLNEKHPLNVRLQAVADLIRHIQQHSPTLARENIARLEALQASPDTNANFKASLSLLMGSLRPDARTAGERLLRFQPALPEAPALPPIKEDNKEDKKD